MDRMKFVLISCHRHICIYSTYLAILHNPQCFIKCFTNVTLRNYVITPITSFPVESDAELWLKEIILKGIRSAYEKF